MSSLDRAGGLAFGDLKKLSRIIDLIEWPRKNLDGDILRVRTSETTSTVKRWHELDGTKISFYDK